MDRDIEISEPPVCDSSRCNNFLIEVWELEAGICQDCIQERDLQEIEDREYFDEKVREGKRIDER